MKGDIINLLNKYQAGYTPIMMAALAGVVKEDDKGIARKLFKTGDINKQVEEVSLQIRPFLPVPHFHSDGVILDWGKSPMHST